MSEPDYPFNDELLLRAEDRRLAKQLYPNLYEALDHPELGRVFKPVDDAANAAKSRSRRWGFVAVFLVTAALPGTSAEPLYAGWGELTEAFLAFSALAGRRDRRRSRVFRRAIRRR